MKYFSRPKKNKFCGEYVVLWKKNDQSELLNKKRTRWFWYDSILIEMDLCVETLWRK